MLQRARADKRGNTPNCSTARCQLVIVGLATGGRWSSKAVDFVSQLAGHTARQASPVLRGSAFFAWLRRWQRMLSVSCAGLRVFVGALTI